MCYKDHRSFPALILFLTISSLLLVGPLGTVDLGAESSIPESRILKVGEPAPPFTAETIDGEVYDLGDALGQKPILLFFWSMFCGPCREEMPVLQEIYTQIGPDKLDFVGINLDGKGRGKVIKAYIADSKFQFVSLFDELDGMSYKVADPYGITGTPTVYFIGPDGNIAFSHVGNIQPDELRQVIEGILGGG